MIPSSGVGVEMGVPFRREGGSASGRETPAVSKSRSCVFRRPEDGRRFFVVLEAAPRRLKSGEDLVWKRTETGEGAQRHHSAEWG